MYNILFIIIYIIYNKKIIIGSFIVFFTIPVTYDEAVSVGKIMLYSDVVLLPRVRCDTRSSQDKSVLRCCRQTIR